MADDPPPVVLGAASEHDLDVDAFAFAIETGGDERAWRAVGATVTLASHAPAFTQAEEFARDRCCVAVKPFMLWVPRECKMPLVAALNRSVFGPSVLPHTDDAVLCTVERTVPTTLLRGLLHETYGAPRVWLAAYGTKMPLSDFIDWFGTRFECLYVDVGVTVHRADELVLFHVPGHRLRDRDDDWPQPATRTWPMLADAGVTQVNTSDADSDTDSDATVHYGSIECTFRTGWLPALHDVTLAGLMVDDVEDDTVTVKAYPQVVHWAKLTGIRHVLRIPRTLQVQALRSKVAALRRLRTQLHAGLPLGGYRVELRLRRLHRLDPAALARLLSEDVLVRYIGLGPGAAVVSTAVFPVHAYLTATQRALELAEQHTVHGAAAAAPTVRQLRQYAWVLNTFGLSSDAIVRHLAPAERTWPPAGAPAVEPLSEEEDSQGPVDRVPHPDASFVALAPDQLTTLLSEIDRDVRLRERGDGRWAVLSGRGGVQAVYRRREHAVMHVARRHGRRWRNHVLNQPAPLVETPAVAATLAEVLASVQWFAHPSKRRWVCWRRMPNRRVSRAFPTREAAAAALVQELGPVDWRRHVVLDLGDA